MSEQAAELRVSGLQSEPDAPPGTEAPGRAALRGAVVLVLGIVTAFALFWVMQALVTVSGKMAESSQRLAIEFVRLRKDRAPDTKEREPPKRQKPEQQPPPPEMNMAKAINPAGAVGNIVPMLDTGVELEQATSLTGGSLDRDPVPLVRVDPEYPPRAKQQGIQGFVQVEFTITPVGTVADAVVIASKPPYVFDRAALQAVRRWKYNPMIKEGAAVSRPGVRVHFKFDPGSSSR